MRIIPMEHRDIIASSDYDADIEEAGEDTYIWSVMLPLCMSLMFGFSSCNDNELPVRPERDLVPASFSVEVEGETGTRLSFGDKDTKMNWEVGDKIKLYDGCSSPHVLEYTSTGKFEGSVCQNSSFSDYRAVYPVSATSSYNDVTIGATQTAVNGSFDKASVPMIAYAPEKNKLSFNRAFSLLKITVPAGYSKIVVSNYDSSGGASYLTGTATLTYNSDVSVVKNSGNSSVTLVPSSGSEIAEGTYYLSVFPCTLTGLQLSCYKGDKVFFKCKADNSAIARNKVIKIGDLTDSNWSFTCEAFKITPSGSSRSYYLADRNLGATNTSAKGNTYTKKQFTTSTPSSVWGPGWRLPYRLELTDWADMIDLSTFGDIAVTGEDYPKIYFPLCPYWGFEEDGSQVTYLSLYITEEGTYTEIIPKETATISSTYPASIRPVFTVPAP